MATFQNAVDTAKKVYLNDESSRVYTDARMFEVAKEAFRNLKSELGLADDQVFREIQAITYTAGGTTLTFTSLIKPVFLEERDANSTNVSDYKPIMEQMWELGRDRDATADLRYWAWREQSIQVLPATTNRTVRGYFDKSLADPAAIGDPISITFAEEYLAPRIAALASAFIGNNPERASACDTLAKQALDRILGRSAKSQQSLVVKRKPYRGRRPIFIHSR